jgi:hypothetical protein
MLKRVALERNQEREYADVLLEFASGVQGSWPDLIEASASGSSVRLRLRVHLDELELLAVALDGAVLGGDGELYFSSATSRSDEA